MLKARLTAFFQFVWRGNTDMECHSYHNHGVTLTYLAIYVLSSIVAV